MANNVSSSGKSENLSNKISGGTGTGTCTGVSRFDSQQRLEEKQKLEKQKQTKSDEVDRILDGSWTASTLFSFFYHRVFLYKSDKDSWMCFNIYNEAKITTEGKNYEKILILSTAGKILFFIIGSLSFSLFFVIVFWIVLKSYHFRQPMIGFFKYVSL